MEIKDIASLLGLLKLGFDTVKSFRDIGSKTTIRKTDFESQSPLSPLSVFKSEKVSVFMSSLFAPPPIETNEGTLYFLYSTNGERLSPVGSGCFVTGLSDALGLAKLAVALIQQSCDFTYELEESLDTIRNNHLILIGGPSSNAVGKRIYEECIPVERKFLAANGGITVGNTVYSSGEYAWLTSLPNPWNSEKRVLWMAGLGPFGTEAAIDYAIGHFSKRTPPEVQSKKDWTIFVKGVLTESGQKAPPEYVGTIS